MRTFIAVALACALAVAGCSRGPQATADATAYAPAQVQAGDITLHASTLPVSQLNPAMAQRYSVDRDSNRVLLVIGMRRGTPSQETSVEGRVVATASDLLGNKQQIALSKVVADGYVDYVGTAKISLPDTLRFEIRASPAAAPAMTLRFHRDYFR